MRGWVFAGADLGMELLEHSDRRFEAAGQNGHNRNHPPITGIMYGFSGRDQPSISAVMCA